MVGRQVSFECSCSAQSITIKSQVSRKAPHSINACKRQYSPMMQSQSFLLFDDDLDSEEVGLSSFRPSLSEF